MARIFRKLAQLLDVDLVSTPPADGDSLTYDDGTETWVPGAGGGGGGVTDADYLVGTANAGLSAEIVVGTSPGGELGGTWASPTVDATHAGSSHATVQSAAEATAAAALSGHASDTTGVHGITDTANLSLTGHAHAGEDITSGTVADARIASTIARDSEVTSAISTSESGQVRDGDTAGGVLGGTYPNPSFAADMATQAELDAHVNDTSAAHAASAVSVSSTTLVGTGTDVQAVFEELDDSIADHLADTSAAHAATAISFSPEGTIAATNVQAAIQEVRDEAGGGISSSLFDANTILKADTDNTPTALTMGASTILARLAAGDIKAASVSEIVTLLGLGTFASYTPALTASSSNPTLGSGSSALGRWCSIGKLAVVQAHITFGTSGTAAGSGNYRISLPFTNVASPIVFTGVGIVYDASLFDSFVVMCTPIGSQAYTELWWANTQTAGAVSHTTPVPWTNSDQMLICFIGEMA